jgi:predicted MFS family arabinose efflux permease
MTPGHWDWSTPAKPPRTAITTTIKRFISSSAWSVQARIRGIATHPYHPAIVEPTTRERSLRPAVATLLFLKLVANTAFRFVYPFLPAIARGLGIDLTQAGALVSVRWASSLATPAVMSFAGRVPGSRRLLIVGLIVFSAGSIVTAWTGVFAGALIGFALLGLAKPMIDISGQVYVSERVAYEQRARYLGIMEIAWAGGLLIGAPVAGWLIANWSWKAPFWVVGSLGLLGIGLARLFLEREDAGVMGAAVPDSPGRQVMLILATIALFSYAHESVLVTLGGWLEISFGMTLIALGAVGTLIGVSELIGEISMASFTDRIGKRNSLALGIGVSGVALLGLSTVTEQLIPAMAVLFVAGVAIEFGIISAIPLMTELRPRARAQTLSLLIVASGMGRATADLVAPRVFTGGGMVPVVVMAGLVALGSLLIVLLWVREVRAPIQEDEAAAS